MPAIDIANDDQRATGNTLFLASYPQCATTSSDLRAGNPEHHGKENLGPPGFLASTLHQAGDAWWMVWSKPLLQAHRHSEANLYRARM